MEKINNLPVKRRRGRPTKIEVMNRTREVAAMLLMATPRSEIIQHCMDKYGIQETSVAAVVTRAYQYISRTHAVDRDGVVSTHLEMYYEVYAQSKGLGDSRGCIQALNSIEKLLKLTDSALIQNNSLTVNLKDLTLTELKQLLQLENK